MAAPRSLADDVSSASSPADSTNSETPLQFAIVDRPIEFDEERVALTLAYREAHQGEKTAGMTIVPRVVVLHYTDSDSADATFQYFNRSRITSDRVDVATASQLNVSAHFLVDRDGTTWRLMPETWFARHCIGLNHVAIGVENVGDGEGHPLTARQAAANVALIRKLVQRFPTITHVIGHYEYRAMERHPYFLERDAAYRTEKEDPGPEHMARVRRGIADLGLSGPPAAGG